MPPSVVIRKAKRSDVSLILEYIGELAKFQNAADQVEATPELLEKNLVFDSNTSSAHAHCILATYDGKPAGMALYFFNFSTWTGRPGIYLEDLFVREQFRGLKIGLSLLAALAEIALKTGATRMEWVVLKENTSGIKFYEGLGAHELHEWAKMRVDEQKIGSIARLVDPDTVSMDL